jgi:GNAT superfamily N-acetyltransferase
MSEKLYFSCQSLDNNMTSLVIRAATIKDISSIVRIRLETLTDEEINGFSAPEFATYSSTEELQKVWYRDNKLRNGFEVFVAEEKGKILGFIVFKVEAICGYIDYVLVAKREQKKGIGSALVMFVEKIAKSQGCHLMKTDTTENASGVPWKSYEFWLRMGYEDTGERLPTNYDFKEISLVKRLKCV